MPRHALRGSQARSERGQAAPLVVALIAIGLLLVVGIARLGRSARESAQSRTAADAGALAGAAGGNVEEVVAANGGRVITRSSQGDTFVVTAQVGEYDTTAAAAVDPIVADGAGPLDPVLVAAIARAESLLGAPVPIVSGRRSSEEQRRLWDQRFSNPYPVAPPGTSDHERGLAIDVPLWFVARLRSVAAIAGLCQPLPVSDPVHFTACRTTTTR